MRGERKFAAFLVYGMLPKGMKRFYCKHLYFLSSKDTKELLGPSRQSIQTAMNTRGSFCRPWKCKGGGNHQFGQAR